MNLNITLSDNWTQRHENINTWVLDNDPSVEITTQSRKNGWDIYATTTKTHFTHVTSINRYNGTAIYASDADVQLVTKHAIKELAYRIEKHSVNTTRSQLNSPINTDDMRNELTENITNAFNDIETFVGNTYDIQTTESATTATLTVNITSYDDLNMNAASVAVDITGEDTPTYTTLRVLYNKETSKQALTLQTLIEGLHIAADSNIDTVHIRLHNQPDLIQQLQSVAPNKYDTEYTGENHVQLALSGEFARTIKPFEYTIEPGSGETPHTTHDITDRFYNEITTHTKPYSKDVIATAIQTVSNLPEETTTTVTA